MVRQKLIGFISQSNSSNKNSFFTLNNKSNSPLANGEAISNGFNIGQLPSENERVFAFNKKTDLLNNPLTNFARKFAQIFLGSPTIENLPHKNIKII